MGNDHNRKEGAQAPISAVPLRWVKVNHHSPDHIAARYLYAAYGSNLSLAQIATRCPGIDIAGQGLLRNARLVFAHYLGIVPDDSSSVPVGLFRCTAADVASLDRREGLGQSYDRYLVTVEQHDRDGNPLSSVRCFTYVKRHNEPEPSADQYWQTCLMGYRDFRFDDRRLRHARDHARKHHKPRRHNGARGWANGMPPIYSGDSWGDSYPEGNGSGPSYRRLDRSIPRTSLVTGRTLPMVPSVPSKVSNDEAAQIKADAEAFKAALKARKVLPQDFKPDADGVMRFTNQRTGETWIKVSRDKPWRREVKARRGFLRRFRIVPGVWRIRRCLIRV